MSVLTVESPVASSRVIVATIERPNGDTGVHAHTRALLQGFARAGVDAQLVNPFCAGAKWLTIFAFRKLLLKPLNKTWALRWYRHWHRAALKHALAEALSRDAVDAVIAQCPVSALAALAVREQLKLDFTIAMVCHFNFSEATEYRDKGEIKNPEAIERMMKLEALVLESVDQVIYVSNWAKQVVEQERKIRPRESRVIWNGIASLVDARALTREELGISPDDVVLINVGSLEPRKNQIGLLDLFQRVRQEEPHAKLLLVGDGPDRTAIEQKIRAQNLTESVLTLGHRTDVPALLNLADIYVHYSKLENCPVILLEAARAGLPIAAIPNGGVGEIGQKLGGIVEFHENDLNESLVALRPLLAGAQRGNDPSEPISRMAVSALGACNSGLSSQICHPECTGEGSGLDVRGQILRQYAQDDNFHKCESHSLSAGTEPPAPGSVRRWMGRRVREGFESHFTRDAMIAQYLDALGLNHVPAEVTR